jgi:DNA-binding GntR family transcriptional regulator
VNIASGGAPKPLYDRLRDDIIQGRLPPGMRLRLDALKERYGAGAGHLREVLGRLAAQRFVVAEGQRGFEVAAVSIANLHEIADLRLLLECRALELSFMAGDTAWESHVVAAHHMLARAEETVAESEEHSIYLWKKRDWEFHQALISACASRIMKDTHALVFDKYLRYQMIALSFRGDVAAGEHREMLDCALAHDWRRACDTLRVHVKGGVAHALATGTIKA